MDRVFTVSATPHLRDSTSIPTVMYSVVIALVPAMIGSVYFFGYRAALLIAISVVACVLTEAIIQLLTRRPLSIADGSAVITGILLAFNLPAGTPWWIPVVGSVFAIAVGKMTFGGLGYNPLNPALVGRVFLLISWPVQMTTTWTMPRGTVVDAETVATPLAIYKENIALLKNQGDASIGAVNSAMSALMDLKDSYQDLFIGNVSGCIGETSAMLLLIGAVFLLYKRYIDWRIPVTFVVTVGILAWVLGGHEGLFTGPWLFHILAGGVILGAFYMATDMVTSPITPRGQFIFGFGCGLLTVVIRLYGGFPEGVSFAIILMNLTVPLIDRYTRPRIFGTGKGGARG
jgi:Na+-translocating ferredoxin:NAD+ oxidoreductase subunit D